MPRFLVLALALLFALIPTAPAQPANSELVVDEKFDTGELGDAWFVNTGTWKPVEGVLRAAEVEADHHSAAARRTIETRNAVYQLRFRFINEGSGFHFGFDPAPGELDKKGHLFSIIITPENWKIMKHIDKARPKDDPSEVLAQEATPFEKGKWHRLRITTWGPHATATIDSEETLRASHATFGVKKPTLVFRCLGDGVEIDDLKVWTEKKP